MLTKKHAVRPNAGCPGSVRLRFAHGAVRVVPVSGSDGSSGKRGSSVFMYSSN